MASDNANNIINSVLMAYDASVPSADEIMDLASKLRLAYNVSDKDFEYAIRIIHSRRPHTMDLGSAVVAEDHKPWYNANKPDIIPYYWDRYSRYLIKQGWTPTVTRQLDRVTDKIMDLMENPKKEGKWDRKGLVVGDVQSGKTSTYTALCCKGADAGYRLIILLTGTLENLRRQTQERLDAGFIGRDSSGLLAQQKQNRLIGAGLIDSNRHPGVFTSIKNDFKSDLATQLGFKVDAHIEPILVVVKKHKKILENLENWLRDYNANANGFIDTPLLIIDDEADNASVDTTADGEKPTAINSGIRSLLKLFTRSTYVGFTATPFANIFIDPNTDDSMLEDDLFPRDFVFSLDPPTNYIGAEAIFGPEGKYAPCLRTIEDADEWIPTPHKSSHRVNGLSKSLEWAIYSFVLANAIRDIRNEGATHRSMLVNVSRFTDVQEDVAEKIDDKLRRIQQDIRNYSQLPAEEAMLNETILMLNKVWNKEYSSMGHAWDEVRKRLLKASLPITVMTVNQKRKKGKATLDYKAHREDGLRVIAVGGNSLSRGLTLEGLCVSYFYRNSQAYDTLMQMGRWFGYREEYDDLCRVWMSGEAIQWYRHISLSTTELRDEISKMEFDGLTPMDFGLKVRAHPDSVIVSIRNLIVTARNKMRTARTVERLVSLSEQGPETPRLHTDPAVIKANAKAVERLIIKLRDNGKVNQDSEYGEGTIWRGVSKKFIIELLREFTVHSLNFNFQSDSIAAFLERTDDAKLQLWDIVLPSGSIEVQEPFAGIKYSAQKRTVDLRGKGKFIVVSGSSARVGSRGVEKEGLRTGLVDRIQGQHKNPSDKHYRAVRERPLLILHFIEAVLQNNKRINETTDPMIALGLSFPKFDDSSKEKKVTYKVNLVEWKNMFEDELDDDDVENEELIE